MPSSSRRPRVHTLVEWLRWLVLAAAVAMLVVFLVAQGQRADVRYGQSPATGTIAGGSAGEQTGVTLPSVQQLTAMVAASPVVRLPGSIAMWDTDQVARAIGGADVHILVTPPGLSQQQREEVDSVDNATVRVIGTEVSGDVYKVASGNLADWRATLGRADVTSGLVLLINKVAHGSSVTHAGSTDASGTWRDPTAAELDPVAADLRSTGFHAAKGATLSAKPTKAGAQAFGTGGALYVALPAPPPGAPAPDYGPALGRLFPDTPLVVMYGDWIEYQGPHAADFAELAAASFYARFGDRLSGYAYSQDQVLGAYLATVTDIRYAGLFDRPLPYRPADPLRIALPALPWLFAACVLAFLALSVRSLLRPAKASRSLSRRTGGDDARLAGLTALAVEVSGLTGARTDPALARAIVALRAAREALDERLPRRRVSDLLDEADRELDLVGRRVEFPGYRPAEYLRGRLA